MPGTKTSMRRLLLPGLVTIWAVAATVSWASAVNFAGDVSDDQGRLQHQLTTLRKEHRALQVWVAEELQPWVKKQAKEVAEVVATLPSDTPTPSFAPLAPAPTVAPSSSPSETVAPIPTETLSPTCVPVIDICTEPSSP